MPDVSLRPITRDNVRAVCELELAPGQEDLVAPAAFTIAECHYEPSATLEAIYVDDTPAGILSVILDPEDHDVPYLVRFMVDGPHQRQGIGRRALDLLYEELRGQGITELEVSWNPREGGAGDFWRGQGFAETGAVTYGEPVGRRSL
jgi:diamine N-acetyltransferase